jgi:hypothetical protein
VEEVDTATLMRGDRKRAGRDGFAGEVASPSLFSQGDHVGVVREAAEEDVCIRSAVLRVGGQYKRAAQVLGGIANKYLVNVVVKHLLLVVDDNGFACVFKHERRAALVDVVPWVFDFVFPSLYFVHDSIVSRFFRRVTKQAVPISRRVVCGW